MKLVYRVAEGESIEDIAVKTGADGEWLKKYNNITEVQAGMRLVVAQTVRHLVTPFDTFPSVARALCVSEDALSACFAELPVCSYLVNAGGEITEEKG